MPKDYKHSGQARRRKDVDTTPGWIWLIGGFVLGFGTAMGVTWLQQSDTELPRIDLEAAKAERDRQREEQGEEERERFSFYRMLESFEVVVPEEEVRIRTPRTSDESREQPALPADGRYVLQVGSFRRESDADRLRAELGMAGFESHIQRVSIDDGQTYYRVRVGPIEGTERLERTRGRLEDQGIEPLLIRLRDGD
ncbi:SPOR domain-containing protein [Natronospira bacteriovora]|uniref:SPOR domain-containing protein n=1 Tax=Natronospira bacteriovora TaxID=3069753 RepID=A0ABU0W7F4_9GAMM|nr:SPOR domain-containing protein [Natronospira sp. AB-CW4]MDQ2069934.1 SPOR domain-containing protein [Natronospira sp. AB-CW4]